MERDEICQILLRNQSILPAWLSTEMNNFPNNTHDINYDANSKIVTESYLDFLLEKSGVTTSKDERFSEFKSRHKALKNHLNKNVTYLMIYNSTHNFSLIIENESKNVIHYTNNW